MVRRGSPFIELHAGVERETPGFTGSVPGLLDQYRVYWISTWFAGSVPGFYRDLRRYPVYLPSGTHAFGFNKHLPHRVDFPAAKFGRAACLRGKSRSRIRSRFLPAVRTRSSTLLHQTPTSGTNNAILESCAFLSVGLNSVGLYVLNNMALGSVLIAALAGFLTVSSTHGACVYQGSLFAIRQARLKDI
ncbi:hypothetical protein DPEC_G00118930 [Dallia pectoralis]|uniref:Uncharacterized protein n=1 Tax=Dallia pectoralis TaxID=75939 RepID=A0ACC2GPP3_DALPE|nr:hypothetical protein DPEC_G00118930 [Dallia pectoralis]